MTSVDAATTDDDHNHQSNSNNQDVFGRREGELDLVDRPELKEDQLVEEQAMGADLEERMIGSPVRPIQDSEACNACTSGGSACVVHSSKIKEVAEAVEEVVEASNCAEVVKIEDMRLNHDETGEMQAAEHDFSVEIESKAQLTKNEIGAGHIGSCNGNTADDILTQEEEQSPSAVSSPRVALLLRKNRRSESSRSGSGPWKLNNAKTRSSSLNSQGLVKPPSNMGIYAAGTPESHSNQELRERSRKGEDGEGFRHASSSEELNGDVDEDDDEVMEGTGYMCGMCEAEFESAKSLSLHKKQHLLRRNPKRTRKFIDRDYTPEGRLAAQAPLTVKKSSSVSDEFPKPCTECGKEFSSWKALFGHMRCHPEREWRGIQPPAEKNNSGGLGTGIGSAGGGSHTSSRRKKPPPPTSSIFSPTPAPYEDIVTDMTEIRNVEEASDKVASDNESDTDSYEAAYINGDRQAHVTGWMTGKRSKRSRQTHRSLDAVNGGSRLREDIPHEEFADVLMLLKERKEPSCTPEPQGRANGNWMARQEPEAQLPLSREKDQRAKQKTEVDHASLCGDTEEGGEEWDTGEQGSNGRTKYECATCKRHFKSHQALGGHRASHKKVKGCFARTNPNEGAGGAHELSPGTDNRDDDDKLEEEPTSLREQEYTSHDSEDEVKPCYLTAAQDDNEEMITTARKAKAHECSICHRIFASGQALGGHKRCHWGGGGATTAGAAEPSTSTTTKPTSTITRQLETTGQQSRPLKEAVLDLNLPPAPESLEEEAGLSVNYVPFFNLMSNAPHNPYTDGAESSQHSAAFLQGEDFESKNNRHQLENQTEGRNQFTGFELGYGPLDALTVHQKPHVGLMASVSGLTPTSA